MKTSNRVSNYAGKVPRSTQSAKTTKTASEKPAESSPENPDTVQEPSPFRAIHGLFCRLALPNKIELAEQRASAVLELLRCKLVADVGDAENRHSPNYDRSKTQKLCGLLELIDNAEKSLQEACDAEHEFYEEFRRLAQLPT